MTNRMKRQLTNEELAERAIKVEEYKDTKEIKRQEKRNEYLNDLLKGKEWLEYLPYRFEMKIKEFKSIKGGK